MAQKYCKLCKRNVEAKRQIGVGTLILILLTGGFWILLIPFYSQRCSICKSNDVGKFRQDL
jgi:hypothetical protein